MKSILMTLGLALLFVGTIQAQGLQKIDVETFYISDANDAAFPMPDNVPLNSTTYRVYVHLSPGYELVSIYGQNEPATGKIDVLRVETTTTFFNNEDRGALFGYDIGLNRLDEGTVMIDSYWTTGRTSGGTEGVLKPSDTDGAIANGDGVLQNNDPAAGIPINTQDGSIPSTSTVTWSATPNFGTLADPSFGSTNGGGSGINSDNVGIGVTVPLVGPDADNRVLIGQFTTDGDLTFGLNLQIRETANPSNVEEWVWETPQAGQFTHPSLSFAPNTPPTVSITAPAPGTSYIAGQTVNTTADATDVDGTITQVEFFFNGVSISVDNAAPYEASFPATASGNITAVATDDAGASTTSAPVNIVVAGNDPPTVNITVPASAIVGDNVLFTATASDPDGTVDQVEFFVDGVSIGVDLTAPYEATWPATTAGTFVVSATATDNIGATGSDQGSIQVFNNQVPIVTLTSHANNDFVAEGPVLLTADAIDNDGTVTSVEFFVDGVSVGVDNAAPFEATWNAVFVSPTTINTITVEATDDRGDVGTSAPVGVRVSNPAGAPWLVKSVTQFCTDPTVCMPIGTATGVTVQDIIGFDIVLNFDNSKIFPTGQIFNSSDLVDASLFDTDFSIDFANGTMLISVFFKTNAPIGSSFDGSGDILCVEFAKRPAFDPADATTVDMASILESYPNTTVPYDANIQGGDFVSERPTDFNATVRFWADDSPIAYDAANPGDYLITNISGTDASCTTVSPISVQPNLLGEFTHDLNNGLSIQFDRDIAGTTDVLPVINGFDALQVRKLLIDQLASPSAFQILAMDVNLDGRISAGDVSQLNQRAVLFLPEFQQAWNYNQDGTPNGAGASKDWVWVDQTRLNIDAAFRVSTTFPSDDGTGYSKFRVPVLPFCLEAPVTDFAGCPDIMMEDYKGILLGDIDGNYKDLPNDGTLRSADMVIVDISEAIQPLSNTVEIPVFFEANVDVNTVDLALTFDSVDLTYKSVRTTNPDLDVLGYYNANDNTLRITSNSLNTLHPDSQVFLITFEITTGISADVFDSSAGYLNGGEVPVEILETTTGLTELDVFNLKVYPNPTSSMLTIEVAEEADIEFFDIYGRRVLGLENVLPNTTQAIDMSSLASGIYMLNVYNGEYYTTKRIIVSK